MDRAKRVRYVFEHEGMGYSKAQLHALEKFGQPGGHGYGEYAFLPRNTAQALEKRGLVKLGRKARLHGEPGATMPWGEVTEEGRMVLDAWRVSRGLEPSQS